jgi:hypothetical protein
VSTAAGPARLPARPATPQPRHRAPLRVVPDGASAPGRASSGAFAVFVAAVLAIGLLGLLVLNTLLAQGAFTTGDLSHRQAALQTTAEALEQQVAMLESSQVLATAAHQLGMVVTKNPVFLDPVTGRVWGVPMAGAYPVATVSISPGAPGARVGTVAARPTKTATATAKPVTKPTTVKPNTVKPTTVKPTTVKPTTKPTSGSPKPGSH